MKTKQLLSRTLCTAMFAGALLFGSSSVFAQVKIGTNPTTIGSNSNLEVEASNSKKVIVNKTSGTVVIENTPMGALTDSIVTVDASGNIKAYTKQMLKKKLGMSGSGSMASGGSQPLPVGVSTVPNFVTTLLDEEAQIDLTNDLFDVKVPGIYTISSTVAVTIPGTGQSANVTVWIQRNVGGTWTDIGRNSVSQNSTFIDLVTVTMAESLNLGDKIRVVVAPCNGCITGNPNFTLNRATLFLSKTD